MQERDFWFRRETCLEEYTRERFGEGIVSFQTWQQKFVVALLLICGAATVAPSQGWTQETGTRKAKVRVAPKYQDLARRMKIAGLVKVQAAVAPNGTVKEVKVIGGHPVLASAALEAVQKWRFETAPQETSETLEFRFDPNE